MAVCLTCRHMAPLPVRDLVRRYGDLCPVEMALLHLRCEERQQSKVQAVAMTRNRAISLPTTPGPMVSTPPPIVAMVPWDDINNGRECDDQAADRRDA
jgi:hypothetical protein